MGKNIFNENVEALFNGMERVFSTKTVVGDPREIGDTLVVPLVDVSFGMGTGALGKEKSDNSMGGMNGKMSPCAVLIIKDGSTRLVNVKNQDAVNRVLDMVPEAVDKVSALIKSRGKEDPQVTEAVDEIIKNN